MTRRSRRHEYRDQSGRLKARMLSMVVMLFIIALLYNRAKDARTWSWLVKDADSEPVALAGGDAAPVAAAVKETTVPGPNDLEAEELQETAKLLAAVTDQQKLADVEMPAYWRLLRWALSQSFAELSGRALRNVPLTKLHEEPDKYRGKPLRLTLNVRRILDFDAPENSTGLKKVYEAWGWTDDSKARPYVVVFPDLPAGIRVGTEVEYEVVFAGYFLKWMQYETYTGKKQSAPLLLGRLESRAPAVRRQVVAGWSAWDFVFLAGGLAIIIFGVRSAFRRETPRRRLVAAEDDVESAMEFFRAESGAEQSPDAHSSPNGRPDADEPSAR